jgi:hypothetical protein
LRWTSRRRGFEAASTLRPVYRRGRAARHLTSVTYPMRIIGLGRQRILLSSVATTSAIDRRGFAAHGCAMVGYARCTPGRGCGLMAPDPMRLCLTCDHHCHDRDIAKNSELRHFLLQIADLFHRIARLAFDPAYSGTRQSIFECQITVTRSGIWRVQFWVASTSSRHFGNRSIFFTLVQIAFKLARLKRDPGWGC